MFHLVAIAVVASVLAHSSTDVLVARWFERAERERAVGGEDVSASEKRSSDDDPPRDREAPDP
jgi:hypothetical protein